MRVRRREDGFHVISRITGPAHNMVALEVARLARPATYPIDVAPPIGTCRHGPLLTADTVRPWIDEAVSVFNEGCEGDLAVAAAQVVANDNPVAGTYRLLVLRILDHAWKELAPE